jgi:hypothetical protein
MVKMVPDLSGRFPRRPYYENAELDRECEAVLGSFLRRRRGEVRFPVDTDDLRSKKNCASVSRRPLPKPSSVLQFLPSGGGSIWRHCSIRSMFLVVDPGDGIARVKLTMPMLSNWDNGLTQRFEIPFEDNETPLHEALAAQYGTRNPLLLSLRPVCARIDVRFQPLPGQRTGKKVSMTITSANKCNLRGKDAQERLILDRYLRDWGIYRGR